MRSPLQLFKDSVTLVRSNIMLFLGISLIPMTLSFVFSLLEPAGDTGMANEWLIYLPLMIFGSVLSILMSVALILAFNNPSLSVGDSYKQAMKHFWRYIGLSILLGAALLIGFMLLIVPGLIFSVWFAFATFVLVLEKAGIVESMKKSREYVRGRWWAVFGRLILVTLIAFFGSVAAAMVASMLPDLIGGVIELAVSIILVPILVGYTYLMFLDVKGGVPASPEPVL